MHYTYILESQKDGSHYVGITDNLERRIKAHNLGYSRYTSTKRPYKLCWYCAFPNKQKAAVFEKYLKTGSGIAFSRKRLV